MLTGKVKWFNAVKGYGFIEQDDGGADAFIHITALQQAGLSNLVEGQAVKFELVDGKNGKAAAENLSIVE